MLLSYIADRNLLSFTIHDGNAKEFLCQENALGMVTQGSVSEIRKECFRFVKPVMNWEIVFCSSTELPCAALCVFEWVGHGATPRRWWSCNPQSGHCARPSASRR